MKSGTPIAAPEPAFRLLRAGAGIMISKKAKMARTLVIESDAVRLVMDVRTVGLTEDQFFRLCRDNRDLKLELSVEGELIVMSPPNMETARKNVIVNRRRYKKPVFVFDLHHIAVCVVMT
jgi:hypothetical protein